MITNRFLVVHFICPASQIFHTSYTNYKVIVLVQKKMNKVELSAYIDRALTSIDTAVLTVPQWEHATLVISQRSNGSVQTFHMEKKFLS